MKRPRPALLIPAVMLLPALLLPAAGNGMASYRLEYQILGSAVSRILLLFPLRVYYEASAAVDLTATRHPDGCYCFSYAGLPRPAYIVRTLGFGGKALAILSASEDADAGSLEPFAGMLLAQWRQQAPEFAARAKTIKRFPHRLQSTGPLPFGFARDGSGRYRDFVLGMEPRYLHYPSRTGIYFNVFPLLSDLLRLFNHPFLPGDPQRAFSAPLPAEWSGDAMDLSGDLNRAAGLLEKVVKSLVTVEQKFPFRLRFRVTASCADEIEICGEGFPDVPLWKGFMIREVFRRVRLRPADGELLADEIWMGIRNHKGQGGSGRLSLKRIETKEDDR